MTRSKQSGQSVYDGAPSLIDSDSAYLCGLRSGLFSFFWLSKRVKLLFTNCWLSGLFVVGLSTIGKLVGSYASFVSSAKMLLFFTRLACFSLSTLGRLLGEEIAGEGERSGVFSSKRKGDMFSRGDQKARGDVSLVKGDEFSVLAKGEDSRETIIFCKQAVSTMSVAVGSTRWVDVLTLVAWL